MTAFVSAGSHTSTQRKSEMLCSSAPTCTFSNQRLQKRTSISSNETPVEKMDDSQDHTSASTKAAHFVRHEVKNGVLAAMGIVDSLQEVCYKLEAQSEVVVAPPTSSFATSGAASASSFREQLDELARTLGGLLDRASDCATVLEVGHGNYRSSLHPVDLPSLLCTEQSSDDFTTCGATRFPITVDSTSRPFPADLLLDPQLIRLIHKNAVSNACKYGKQSGLVKTSLQYNRISKTFRMQVENEPGRFHEQLLQMTPEETQKIFQEETQLPIHHGSSSANRTLSRSSGNGAWLMLKCAQSLPGGGHCKIQFQPDKTVLTFECSAEVSPACMQPQQQQQRQGAESDDEFKFPDNTWCIVVEDSAIQRKLLHRFLTKAGIHPDRFLSLGEKPDEIFHIIDTARNVIRQNKPDYLLVIVDEHLDIVEGGSVSHTISGSSSIQALRESLDPCEESRLLSLIRSANDSLLEQKLYMTRAHGFVPKGPIKNGNLMEAIKPWWKRRFQSQRPAKQGQTLTQPCENIREPASCHPASRSSKLGVVTCQKSELVSSRSTFSAPSASVSSLSVGKGHGDDDDHLLGSKKQRILTSRAG